MLPGNCLLVYNRLNVENIYADIYIDICVCVCVLGLFKIRLQERELFSSELLKNALCPSESN